MSELSSTVNQDIDIASNITCRINLEGTINPELITAGDQDVYTLLEKTSSNGRTLLIFFLVAATSSSSILPISITT